MVFLLRNALFDLLADCRPSSGVDLVVGVRFAVGNDAMDGVAQVLRLLV
jgi:hypothetical protein